MKSLKLKEIGKIITGNTPPKRTKDYYNSNDVPFIKPTSFSKERIVNISSSTEYLSNSGAKKGRLVDKGTILVTCIGEIGNVGIVQNPVCFNQQINAIEPNAKICLSEYLAYSLFFIKKHIKDMANAPVVPIINKSQFSEIQIPLPPLPTQRKIVEVLDRAQSLIDKRKEQIKLLDDLIQSTFYDMFGDPVKNDMGWETKQIHEVCDKILGGGTPSKSKPEYYFGDIPWVTPKDMKKLYIHDSKDHINDNAINNSSAKKIPLNSILMVIRSGILKKHLPVAINKNEVAINQDMKAFVLDNSNAHPVYYLYFWIMAQRYILSKVRAVTADNIEFKQIKEMKIILPSIELQNQFAQKVEKIEKQKALLNNSLKLMEDNFNSLMQRAFRGGEIE